ncbi:MAG: DNA-binding protein [Candidatus Aenigmatarchaeota archaeon]
MKVLLDTNILMLSEKFKIDIFSEIERLVEEKCDFFTLKSVVTELKSMSKSTGKKALQARTAIALISSKNLTILNYDGYPDKVFEKIDGYAIATNDLDLAKRLKKLGKTVFVLRQKNKFEIY